MRTNGASAAKLGISQRMVLPLTVPFSELPTMVNPVGILLVSTTLVTATGPFCALSVMSTGSLGKTTVPVEGVIAALTVRLIVEAGFGVDVGVGVGAGVGSIKFISRLGIPPLQSG